jgi:hypothetical protein
VNNVFGDGNYVERQRGNSLEIGVPHESDGIWRDTRLWISMDYCRVRKGKVTEVLLRPFNLYPNDNETILGV